MKVPVINVMTKVVIVHHGGYSNKVYYRVSHNLVTWDIIAAFWLLTGRLHQAMGLTGCTSTSVSRWSAVIGAFQSLLFRGETLPSAICCSADLFFCLLIAAFLVLGILMPLSLLMSSW